MPSPVLDQLRAQVDRTIGVEQSAVVFIQGFAARLQAAVDAALANGASSTELEPVTAEIAAMGASADALAAAITSQP